MIAQLSQLIVSNIRNLGETNLNLGPKFNVFVGANGSGKTSLLEAIHLLGVGRSFRARSIQQVISFGADQCLVRARVRTNSDFGPDGVWLGVSRDVNGAVQYRVGEQSERSSTALTKILPVQLIDVNSPLLLEGGPNYRRQFIDWGVFHVEHSFIDNWRHMRRALEQRNVFLRKKQQPPAVWSDAFVKYATAVDCARLEYIHSFAAIFNTMLQEMLHISNVELKYKRGWSAEMELGAALRLTESLDLSYGYTNRGPHRADLEVLLDGKPAKEVLSRGQLKIFVCIMLLARARLLEPTQASVFLIDDLHAELDAKNCGLFVAAIKNLDCQVFITGIEADLLKTRLQGCVKQMFHVEHGHVKDYTG
jgi:DNA replication and repair protein RecF